MRYWIAAVALMPAMAWGQASQCTSPEAGRVFGQMADEVMALRQQGDSKRVAVRATEILTAEASLNRVLWMSVVDYVYAQGDDAFRLEAVIRARSACLDHFR